VKKSETNGCEDNIVDVHGSIAAVGLAMLDKEHLICIQSLIPHGKKNFADPLVPKSPRLLETVQQLLEETHTRIRAVV
jgi:hypothetical protein